MKKTFTKKLFTMAISLMLLVSLVSAMAISASALPDTGVQDLGDAFYAALTLRYQTVVLNNNGDNTVSAVTYQGENNVEPSKDVFTDAQLWKFEKQADGSYKITSKLDGKCLEVVNMATDNISTVGLWDDNGAECQRFIPYTIYGKYVFVPAHATDKAIEVNQANFSVHIYEYADDKVNEQFHVEIVEVLEPTVSEDTTSEDASTEDSSEAASVESTDESATESADESAVESTVESAEESVAESKAEESKAEESKAASKAESSKATDDGKEEGSILPIVIAVVAVVAVAVVVVIVIKKKKN